MTDKKTVHIYTDGACSCNPGPGGWAAILIYGDVKKEISGGEVETTNNRMELTAAIEGMKALKMPCVVELYTDSAYLHDAFKNGWIWNWLKKNWVKSDKKPVLNVDLWQELLNLNSIHEIHWHKVKGHSDNELNNRCDELARKAIDDLRKEIPCDDEYKLYISVEYANRCGSRCTYIMHNKSCDRILDSAVNITRYKLESDAVIKGLSAISKSSIIGIYITDNSLYDVLTCSINNKRQTNNSVRLSELLMAHDVRLHRLNDDERDANMIACQEEARCEMSHLIEEKAHKEHKRFIKLYISGTANDTIGAWCGLIVQDGIVRELSNNELNSTKNKMRLCGLIECIESIPVNSVVEINTDSVYLYETAVSWLERWQSNGWKKANSQKVSHADLWQKIYDLESVYELYWHKHEKESDDKLLVRCINTSNELLGK